MTQPATPFTAGASASGYLYQCRYALRLMLERLNRGELDAEASVEHYDDIAFERNGTPFELIQTKHHLGTPPDLNDRSADLWKTLRVWAEGRKAGRIQLPQTGLVIITTAAAEAGSAAECLKLGSGRNPRKALRLINAAHRQMTGATLEPARNAFAALSSSEKEELVNAITVLDGSPDVNATTSAIRSALGQVTRQEYIAAFIERLEGWWFAQLIPRMSGLVTTPVRATDVQAHIDDLRESFRLDALPIDYATGAPPDIGIPIDGSTVFVRQLVLIGMLPQRLTLAITDYRRAYAQRSKWLRDNLLMAKHLDGYDELLCGDWEWRFQALEQETLGVTDAQALQKSGRAMYETLLELPRAIRMNCTEAFVGRGSYHGLADKKKVGWHRDFRTQLA